MSSVGVVTLDLLTTAFADLMAEASCDEIPLPAEVVAGEVPDVEEVPGVGKEDDDGFGEDVLDGVNAGLADGA